MCVMKDFNNLHCEKCRYVLGLVLGNDNNFFLMHPQTLQGAVVRRGCTYTSLCIIFPVLPPRPGLSLLSYPSSRLSRILVKVVMSLELRVELESAFDLKEKCVTYIQKKKKRELFIGCKNRLR